MRRRGLAYGQQSQEFYTPAEAAVFARVSESTVSSAIRTGKLLVSGSKDAPTVAHADLMNWIRAIRQVRGGTQSERQQSPALAPPRNNETSAGEASSAANSTDSP